MCLFEFVVLNSETFGSFVGKFQNFDFDVEFAVVVDCVSVEPVAATFEVVAVVFVSLKIQNHYWVFAFWNQLMTVVVVVLMLAPANSALFADFVLVAAAMSNWWFLHWHNHYLYH